MKHILFYFLILSYNLIFIDTSWDRWWTYDGVSGPSYWSLNPKWTHCSKGRKQSPVNINTNKLLFDPGLKSIQYNGDLVEGNLENTGRGLRFNLRANYSHKYLVYGGPLAYEYRLSHLILHFGRENDRGSYYPMIILIDHSILFTDYGHCYIQSMNKISFPGELQLYFYNHILYENYTDAESQPNGLSVISILIQLIENHESKRNLISNEELNKLFETMDQIKYKGTAQISHQLNVNSLLPRTQFFLTYQGSLTEPPCTETVIWIIVNKPIYVQEKNLFNLRNSIVIDGYGDNFRPTQALNNRCITTNIVNNLNNEKTVNNVAKEVENRINQQKTNEETYQVGQLANSTLNQDKDELNGLKKFCTLNNVYGYYTYKANIKQNNLT